MTDSAAIEVIESPSKFKNKGLFRFDINNNLNSYALLDSNDDSYFYISIDSVGKRNYYRGSEVVQWTFLRREGRKVNFEFELFAGDRNYADIEISAGLFKQKNIKLFEMSNFKLIGSNIKFDSTLLDKSRKVYIKGKQQEKCSKLIYDFVDSTTVPLVMY